MTFRLSVIIPTYNRASLVRAAVDSVLRQTVPPHEVLVCDDGSTDDTLALLRTVFADVPKVKVLSLPHSGLPAATRNAGIAAASGEWLGFLDSDDVWLPEKTARQLAVIQSHPAIGLVCANAFVAEHGDDPHVRPTLLRHVPTGEVTLARLLEENVVITSSALVKRTLLVDAGAFSARQELRSVEDHELWLRMATLAPVYYLGDPLIIYQDDTADSVRRGDTPSFHWQAHLTVLDCLRAHLTTAGPTPPDNRLLHAIAKTQLRRNIQRCAALYRESRYASCMRELAMLCATQPLAAAREIASRLFPAAGNRQQQD
jgi:glycosyltransferase involved in cell wall biosynthesis